MTMGDELLLLAITPRRLRAGMRIRSPQRLRLALRAAELAELALAGRVEVGERRIAVRDSTPVDVPRLSGVLRVLAGTEPPPTLEEWLRAAPRSLLAEYVSRLQDRKVIRVRRWRGRDGRTRNDVLAADLPRRRERVARLAAAVRALDGSADGDPGLAYDLALAVLVRSARLTAAVHPGPRGWAARRRLAALTASGGDCAVLGGAVAAAYAAEAAAARIGEYPDRGVHGGGSDASLGGYDGQTPGGTW
ncbi:GPP34 family phosphoprotein [Streptomyces sp. NPDC020983]|uniref:GPP34 family phosphoprotein n=1 Tax=Streptomyces sp. NPDC020983 TaxID=3365106 RepID=UPI00378C3643